MKLKKTIKRIAALSTAATMMGATVLGAMAADLSEYPNPLFIKDGKFDGLIVIGADGDTQDMLGAMDIISSLQAAAVSGTTGTSATTTTVGDTYKFKKVNLGETLTSIRSKVLETHLPIVLADGTFSTAKGSKYDYEQEVTIGTTLTLDHFADRDYENDKPVVGISIGRNTNVLTYSLEFGKSAKSSVDSNDDWTEFEDRQIEILGEVYDIVGSDNSSSELELMRGALKPTLEEGETATYTIDGKEYEVTALIISDTAESVKFKVNGEVTDSMVKGDVYQLADGTNIGAREILPNEAGDITQDLVEFYIGAKKIIMTDGNELEMDDEDISNIDVTIATSSATGGKQALDSITLSWDADDDLFLTEDGNNIIMPGLEALKLSMTSFTVGADEVTRIYGSSTDTISISTALKDYDVKLDILFDDGDDGDFDVIGSDTDQRLIVNTCTTFTIDMDDDQYFLVTKKDGDDGETSVLQLSNVHTTNGVTIKDYNSKVIAEDKKATKTFDVADDITVTVDSFNNTLNTATFTIASGQNCVNATLITAAGLQLTLPTVAFNSTGGTGGTLDRLSAGGDNASWVMTMSEEDKDDNIGLGSSGNGFMDFNATFNSDTEAHVKIVNKNNLTNSKVYSIDDTKRRVGRISSKLASKIIEDKTGDQTEIEITYIGEEAYTEVYLGAKASKVTTIAGSETIAVTKIEVGAAVLDTSLASYTTQNLIVVGGPAINRATAALMGKPYPSYGEDSGIPTNAGVIELVEQADGAVAVIVAGWEADDTQRASRVLAESDNYALSGSKLVVSGTSMTDISVGVPAASDDSAASDDNSAE